MVIDQVQVSTLGIDATVEVRLLAGGDSAGGAPPGRRWTGTCCGSARWRRRPRWTRCCAARQTAERGRCFIEHAAWCRSAMQVAIVVVLLVCEGWVEQVAGSALVAGDPRHAMVRATLAAVNRRLEGLLS